MYEQSKQLSIELFSSEIKSISVLSKAGYKNHHQIKNDNFKLDFEILNLPPVFLGDSEQKDLFVFKNNTLKDFDLDFCFNELYAGQSWVENFNEACV